MFPLTFAGSVARSFLLGWDIADANTVKDAQIRRYRAAMVRACGVSPRFARTVQPRSYWAAMTVKQLRAVLTEKRIAGRSKARTKAAMIGLLMARG